MTARMRTILRGVGSILDICPTPTVYEQSVPKGTAEGRLRMVWTRVGKHIREAAREVRDEPETQPEKVAQVTGKFG